MIHRRDEGNTPNTQTPLRRLFKAAAVVLLAAALLCGAGSAMTNGETIFFYQQLDETYEGTWTYGAYSFTIFSGMEYVADTNLPEGKYVRGDSYLYLKKATASVSAIATSGSVQYIAETLYQGDEVTIKATSPTNAKVVDLFITYPNGTLIPTNQYDTVNGLTINSANLPLGTYTIQALFDSADFVAWTPDSVLVSDTVWTFTVTDDTSVTLSAFVEDATLGEVVGIRVNGKPGDTYTIDTGVCFELTSFGTTSYTGNTFTIPNTGQTVIFVKAVMVGIGKITLQNTDAQVSINIVDGVITAQTEKESYYLGNDVTLSGTLTGNSPLYFYIAGNTLAFTSISSPAIPKSGTWSQTIKGSTFSEYDAGTYTLYVSVASGAKSAAELGTYAIVSLILKQPHISITDAPAVAVQGQTYTVTGTAEATDIVQYYIFGTNKFKAGARPVEDDATYTISTPIDNDLPTGQYFMIIQHPMSDNLFNIWAQDAAIYRAYTKSDGTHDTPVLLFNLSDHQSAGNAVEALRDALDTETIDDVYAKLTFVVSPSESAINPIPDTIPKGSQLTISGVTNLGDRTMVTVEMLAAEFAEYPEYAIDYESFLSLTTVTDEDGRWEVIFDTTGLHAGEYIITVLIDGEEITTTTHIVMEASGGGVGYFPTLKDTRAKINAVTAAEVSYELPPEMLGYLTVPTITRETTKGTSSLLMDEKVFVTKTANGVDTQMQASVTKTGTVTISGSVADAEKVTVIFLGRVLGDVTGDRKADTLDAARLLQASAKLYTLNETAMFYGDVSGDGTANTLDAARILQYSAKLTDENYILLDRPGARPTPNPDDTESDETFTEYYILGANKTADDYPDRFAVNSEQFVWLGIGNHESRDVVYTVEVLLLNAEGNSNQPVPTIHASKTLDRFEVSIPAGQTYLEQYFFTVDSTDYTRVQFLLYNEKVPPISATAEEKLTQAYRDLHLWVRVT